MIDFFQDHQKFINDSTSALTNNTTVQNKDDTSFSDFADVQNEEEEGRVS